MFSIQLRQLRTNRSALGVVLRPAKVAELIKVPQSGEPRLALPALGVTLADIRPFGQQRPHHDLMVVVRDGHLRQIDLHLGSSSARAAERCRQAPSRSRL
jgi:hypothetical protein